MNKLFTSSLSLILFVMWIIFGGIMFYLGDSLGYGIASIFLLPPLCIYMIINGFIFFKQHAIISYINLIIGFGGLVLLSYTFYTLMSSTGIRIH